MAFKGITESFGNGRNFYMETNPNTFSLFIYNDYFHFSNNKVNISQANFFIELNRRENKALVKLRGYLLSLSNFFILNKVEMSQNLNIL